MGQVSKRPTQKDNVTDETTSSPSCIYTHHDSIGDIYETLSNVIQSDFLLSVNSSPFFLSRLTRVLIVQTRLHR